MQITFKKDEIKSCKEGVLVTVGSESFKITKIIEAGELITVEAEKEEYDSLMDFIGSYGGRR